MSENGLISLDDLVMDVDQQIAILLRRVADRHYAGQSAADDAWLAWACHELTATRQRLAVSVRPTPEGTPE